MKSSRLSSRSIRPNATGRSVASGHAVQRDALVGHHRGALARPVRLAVAALDQVGADPLGPLGLDRGVLARPEAAGLDQLAGHQVRRVLPAQGTAREDREPGAAGAEVLPRATRPPAGRACRDPLALLEHADVAQTVPTAAPGGSRRRRTAHPRSARLPAGRALLAGRAPFSSAVDVEQSTPALAQVDLELPAHLAELGLEVLPLADPEVVEVLPLAHPAEGAGREVALLGAQVSPEVEPGQEVGGRGP